LSKIKSILAQLIFWIISFGLYLTVFLAVSSSENPMIVVGIIFTVFYTALGIIIKKHFKLSEPQVTWIQFGGLFTIISALFTITDTIIKYFNIPNISLSDIPIFAIVSVYFVITVPALILSLTIRLIITAVKNNSKRSE